MVHEGLVLELSLITPWVTDAIPRLYADEGSVFVRRTPESTDRCLVVDRNGWLAIDIHQHGTVGLAFVDLHGVVAEEVIVDFQDTLLCLQRDFDHVVAAVRITLENIHRLLVVEFDDALQLSSRHVKGRVSANLEMNLLGVGILDMPDDMYLVVFKAVGDGEGETVGIDFQGLFTVMEGEGDFLGSLANQRKLHVTGKTMTG